MTTGTCCGGLCRAVIVVCVPGYQSVPVCLLRLLNWLAGCVTARTGAAQSFHRGH